MRHPLVPLALVLVLLRSAVADETKVVHVPTPRPYKQKPGVAPLLKEVRAFIRVAEVRASPYNLTGQGVSVAVLDTGVRATHIDFGKGARVVHEVNCLSANKCAEGKGVAADGNGHGTNVTGIIAAGGETVLENGQAKVVNGINEGIANRARVVAVKVLDDNGDGSAKSIEKGLEWVESNRKKYGIRVVNMSLSWTNNLTDDTTYATDPIVKHIRKLREAGVPVVVSAGNHYFKFKKPGMAFPAIARETTSVGAVYDADGGSRIYGDGAIARSRTAGQLTPFSQRLHPSVAAMTYTDVLAPGSRVLSTGIDNDDTAVSEDEGTSQAAPVVSGVILLMQQLLNDQHQEAATVDEIETWLRAGPEEHDGDNEQDNLHEPQWIPPYLGYRRVDALASVEALVKARSIVLAGAAHAADESARATDLLAATPKEVCPGGATAMNLDWSSTDRNGFPRNPWYVMQKMSADPVDPVVCCGGFPGDKPGTGTPVPDRAYGWPQCTTETVLDLPRGLHSVTCALEFVRDFRWGVARGHVNWFPVAVTGYGYYDHQSGPDNDVNFEIVPDTVVPPNRVPGQTRWNAKATKLGVPSSLHVEMKKKETLTHFKQDWWKRLADAKKTEDARKIIPGLRTLVVGLFGVDAEHKGHSELHPAYGLAFRKDCAQSNGVVTETWAILTRNAGNEGWCSRWNELHQLPLGDNGAFVLQLPLDSNAQSITYGSSQLYSNGKDAKVSLISASGSTADVMISASALAEGSLFRVHGIVSFSWKPANTGVAVCVPAPPLPLPQPSIADEGAQGDDAFLESLLGNAAYLRGDAMSASTASAEEKGMDETEVKNDTLQLGPFSRTGPCPAQPEGPCPDDRRARTLDAFLPSPIAAAADVDTSDEADAYVCAAARAMHANASKAGKGKRVDSPEGIELRNLEAVMSACDALAIGN